MTIRKISAKIDSRLNKLASNDYDNIWRYHKEEAFNKAVLEWVRRQKKGVNIAKEGDEETDGKIDDLQILLTRKNLSIRDRKGYYESEKLPADYLFFKRLTPFCSKDNCSNIQLTSYLREEANVDNLREMPSFEFEETFHTLIGNRVNIYYTDFKIDKLQLTYYRLPKKYSFSKLDEEVEFKDDICEILVDEAVKILASDIESVNQKILSQERGEYNS